MNFEQFIAQSEGDWRSMRSGHSIAFKQFEQIVSKISIKLLKYNDSNVVDLLKLNRKENVDYMTPFQMNWETYSDWSSENSNQSTCGSTILIPIPKTNTKGYILKSIGYTEPIPSISKYNLLSDETLILTTTYDNTITEERIWFLSKFVRCRSSVIFTDKKSGILQTSFATEVKIQSKN